MFDKSFLEDEVRLGFYIPATIKQAWAAQLEVLKVIDNICRECNIRYFADWGTFLGAVRHHGYIPWDDDMDIVMIRDDYERFLNEAPKLFPEGYSIHTFRNEDDYREFHAVVVNTPNARFDKDHYNNFHGFNYICGIDIFILDYLYPNEDDEDKRDKDTLYLISLADSILEGNLSKNAIDANLNHVKEITGVFLSSTIDKKSLWVKLYELAEKKCGEVSSDSSNTLTQMVPWGLKRIKNFRFDTQEYYNSLRLPFENTSIPVPLFYNKILSKHYGNYMSINKAGGAHDYPFFEKQKKDLEELLGTKLSEYTFKEEYLDKKDDNSDSFKSLLKEGLVQLSSFNYKLEDDICSAQELAIDMGTMIENVKGENHPCISYINSFCEVLYLLYNQSTDDISIVNNSFDEMEESIEKEILEKKVAVFLPFKADFWNSFENVYASLTKDSNFEVYIVPIPYYYKEFDGTLCDEQYNLNSYPDELPVYPYEDFPLEFLHPDYIFIQNPYDEFNAATRIHPDFYSSIIKNYTENLIYIPWFKSSEIDDNDSRAYKNMQYYVTVPGVVNSDFVLVKTEQEKKMYIKKLEEWSFTSNTWNEKIKLLNECSFKELGISYIETPVFLPEKSVLYYIGSGQVLEHSNVFMDKLRRNISMFKENEDKIKLTLVIDHLLEDLSQKYNPMLWKEFLEYLSTISSYSNITIMYDNEPVKSLSLCSAYYGDASFLACEYSCNHKPVMIQNYDF